MVQSTPVLLDAHGHVCWYPAIPESIGCAFLYLYVTPISLFVCASFRYKRFVTHTYCGGKVNEVQPTLVWAHMCGKLDNDSQVLRTSVSWVCHINMLSSPIPFIIAAQCSSCIFFVVWPLYISQVHYRHSWWTWSSSGTWWTRRAMWAMHNIGTTVASRTNGAGLVCAASIFRSCRVHALYMLSSN